jgi:hypothetical protein
VNKRQLPPIIESYITSLNDKSQNIHIRDNSCAMLEAIRDALDLAIRNFRTEKNKVLAKR